MLPDGESSCSPASSGLTAQGSLVLQRRCLGFFPGGWTFTGIHGHTPVSPDKSTAFDTVLHHLFSIFSASNCPHPTLCSRSHVTGQPAGRLPLHSVATSGTARNEQGGRVGHVASDVAIVGGTAPCDGGISGQASSPRWCSHAPSSGERTVFPK